MMQFTLSIGFALGFTALISMSKKVSRNTLINRLSVMDSKPSIQHKLFSFLSGATRIIRSSNTKRTERALFELADLIELLVVRLSAGEGIYSSLTNVTKAGDGHVSRAIRVVIRAVEYGGSLAVEISRLPKSLPHPLVSEFANKISFSLTRGTPIAEMMADLSLSIRSDIRNRLLRQAGRNETRMLIPLVFLILPVTVLFAIYPSLRLLSFGFI